MEFKKAPNAGYSVVIQKSYAIYTAIASALIFGSPLTWLDMFFIGCVIFFTAMLMIDQPVNKDAEKKPLIGPWAIYSLGAFFLFGCISLSAKLSSTFGTDPIVYLFWSLAATSIISTIRLLKSKASSTPIIRKDQLIYLILMGIFVTIFYYSKNISDILAPNVGFSSAVNASSNAVLIIATAHVFEEQVSMKKFIFAIGAVSSVALLILL